MEFKNKLPINCGIKNLFIEALKNYFSIYSGDGIILNFVEIEKYQWLIFFVKVLQLF
jgi:hypothetical protein